MNPDVLIVDDAEDLVEFMKLIFSMTSPDIKVASSLNGEDALEKIRDPKHRPKVVLLDLRMPGKNGIEILEEIKQDDDLKHVPVCMFSNGDITADVMSCYRRGAAFYFKKPLGLDQSRSFVQSFCQLWFDFATLPTT